MWSFIFEGLGIGLNIKCTSERLKENLEKLLMVLAVISRNDLTNVIKNCIMNILNEVILQNIMKRRSLAYISRVFEEETPSLIFVNNIKVGYL